MDPSYIIKKHDSPIISTALHDGHFIPSAVLKHQALEEHQRAKEEDPYTAYLANLPTSQVIVNTSRFMVDMNRSEDKAIYKTPEDAWGLNVWKNQFPAQLEKGLMDYYFRFYKEIAQLIRDSIQQFRYFLILDIHSYNHRRKDPNTAEPSSRNPEINIGTAYNLPKWRPLIDKFTEYLSGCKVKGENPDVRENIKFKGGGFSQWVIKEYGDQGCVLSVEFKKTFMNEWTGRVDIPHIQQLHKILEGSIPILQNELQQFQKH